MQTHTISVREATEALGVGLHSINAVSAIEVHCRDFSLNVSRGVDLAAAACLIIALITLLGRLAPRRRGARRRAKQR